MLLQLSRTPVVVEFYVPAILGGTEKSQAQHRHWNKLVKKGRRLPTIVHQFPSNRKNLLTRSVLLCCISCGCRQDRKNCLM
eukprot:scaffold86_cov338-Pavlova_lutheri.AAC.41